jgi:hypothetical protein
MKRSSLASRLRAVADACNRAWEAMRCCERRKGRRVSGRGEVEGEHGGFELGMPQVALDEPGIHARFEQRQTS